MEAGRNAEVTLARAVVDDPRMTVERTATQTTVSVSGDPADDVAAFAPIDLHGQLDSGELVSFLSAQNHGLFKPHYVVRAAVFGAHVSDDQLYTAVRFRIDAPLWTAQLAHGESHTVPDDGSVLRAVAPEEGPAKSKWLVYESAQPRSLRDLERRVLASCLALARLALDRPLAVQTVEVRINQDGEWLPVHSQAFSASAFGYGKSLLPREELRVERFANWITLNTNLDGLASAVCELGEGNVQSQVLVDTSLVEGLHRRLPYAQNVGYRTRAQDIIDEVTSAVPELVESVPDPAGKLVAARNDLAHHLVLSEEKEPFAARIDRWAVVSLVTPWLLRLLLLFRAGIEPHALHTACLGSVRFGFTRANVAAIARDLGWLPATDTDT